MKHSKRKKVVYLLRTLNIGGAERYVVETAISLNQEKFEPKIYCISGGGVLQKDASQHGVDVKTFQAPSYNSTHTPQNVYWYARKLVALYRYLKRERPDIVHCYMYTPSIYGGLAAKLVGNAVVFTNRMRLGEFKEQKRYFQLLENVVNKFVDGVLVNSLALKDDVLRREHISPEKIHVVYGGVDVRKFGPQNGTPSQRRRIAQTKREFGIPEQAPVIGMVANLHVYKGYHEFILAASEVHSRYPDARFLCIGKDRGIQNQLEQRVQDLGLHNHVVFTGQLQNIEEIFPVIDIQVSASHEEAFSSSIIEGMASGKPVIATSVGGNPEAVIHNETGLIIPPRDPETMAHALKTLLGNREFAMELGRNGRKRVEEHFSTGKMIEDLETLYLRFCEAKRSPQHTTNSIR
jgi:glycosyltransferase involved in cell wall biosynthesis